MAISSTTPVVGRTFWRSRSLSMRSGIGFDRNREFSPRRHPVRGRKRSILFRRARPMKQISIARSKHEVPVRIFSDGPRATNRKQRLRHTSLRPPSQGSGLASRSAGRAWTRWSPIEPGAESAGGCGLATAVAVERPTIAGLTVEAHILIYPRSDPATDLQRRVAKAGLDGR